MSLQELERWWQECAERRPVATSIAMLDGYVAAIVAGPMSVSPLDWICPLLAVDPDAFNRRHVGVRGDLRSRTTTTTSATTLSNAPHRLQPMHQRKPNGDVDPCPWRKGFHAAMRLRLPAWAPLLDLSSTNHGLLLPILLYCIDDHGRPLLGPARKGARTEEFLRNTYTDIPTVVEAMRQYWMPIRYAPAG